MSWNVMDNVDISDKIADKLKNRGNLLVGLIYSQAWFYKKFNVSTLLRIVINK